MDQNTAIVKMVQEALDPRDWVVLVRYIKKHLKKGTVPDGCMIVELTI